MQYLASVHDGSEGELGNGYWTCNVAAAEVEGRKIVPLVGRLYSAESPEFVSENREILSVLDMVSEAVEKRGLWVIDRGGDCREFFFLLIGTGLCLALSSFTKWPFDNSYKFNYILIIFFALFFVFALANWLSFLPSRLFACFINRLKPLPLVVVQKKVRP